MDIDLALLADAATIDAAGKLNILGIFDRVAVPDFPGRHGKMCIVLRFRAGVNEAGEHELAITLVGPDGREVARANGTFHVTPSKTAVAEGVQLPQVLHVDGIVFDSAGHYAFDVRVDGEHLVSIPLRVGATRPGRA
jgi:hypothetical protein